MLHVHRSHRTEALVERLDDVLATPLDPMQPEWLLVGSPGMQRWVTTALVERSADRGGPGIVANVEVAFPARFVEHLVTDLVGPRPSGLDPWSADALVWTLAGRLPDAIEAHPAPFAAIERYLGVEVTTAVPTLVEGEVARDAAEPTQLAFEVSLDTGSTGLVVDRRALGFAQTTADLFDRYALFRPDVVRAWREGRDVDGEGRPLGSDRWQALLWRTVAGQQASAASPADRIALARDELASGRRLSDAVPDRLLAFGVSTLPPLHLELLAAVAAQREVHLFVPSPSPVLWALGWSGDRGGQPENGLLRAAGPVGRDVAALVAAAAAEACVDVVGGDRDGHHPAVTGSTGVGTLLGRLQAGVVADEPVPVPDLATPDGVVLDRSVVFHDGHGAVRQVEALKDELLRRFDDDPGLQPRDVVVLTPDPRTYAPLVEAVFADPRGRRPDGRPHDGEPPTIPIAVADRRAGGGNPVAGVLRRALALVHARTSGAEVLDLLSTEPVRARFRFTPSELLTLQRWVEDTGVAWARDERDRVAAGQPARRAHTWAAAVDRLLLGVALADEDQRTVGGTVPYDGIEDAGDLDLLDRFTRAVDVVDGLVALRDPRGTAQWAEDLGQLLDRLTGPADGVPWLDGVDREQHRRHRARVDRVLAGLARVDEAVARDVEVRALARWLDGALDATGGTAGHGTGAVTVAELVPLRAIPFRVVCLLGMDAGSFPRGSVPPAHDLVARDPRPGDRDRRDDDRALFLDALLAARDALVVTYAGRDPVSGREQPPAVPVSELRDAVAGLVGREGLRALTHVHAVLPTGPAAFDRAAPGGPSSYDEIRRRAALAGRAGRTDTPAFIRSVLPPDPDEQDTDVVALADLTRRLSKPAQALLDRLRVARPEDLRTFPETEPLSLDPLQRWQVGTTLLDASATGDQPDVEALVDVMLARGPTPSGAVGRHAIAGVRDAVERIHACLAPLGDRREHRLVAPLGTGVRVEGAVTLAVGDRTQLVEAWYGSPDGKRHLRLWLRHLAAAVAMADGAPRSVVVHRAGQGVDVAVHPPVAADTAAAALAGWVELAERCRHEPVPFVAKVGWEYAAGRREAERLAATADGVDLADVEGLDDDDLRERFGHVGEGRRTVRTLLDQAIEAAHGTWGRADADRYAARDDDDVSIVFRHLRRWEDLVAHTDLLELSRTLLRPVVDSLGSGRAEAAAVLDAGVAVHAGGGA